MCESKHDRDPSASMIVTQCYNTPSQGKLDGAYWCVSRKTGRTSSAPTCTLMMLNEWSQVQACLRQNRQGFQPDRNSEMYRRENSTINNIEAT
jgi:hypothetical protein